MNSSSRCVLFTVLLFLTLCFCFYWFNIFSVRFPEILRSGENSAISLHTSFSRMIYQEVDNICIIDSFSFFAYGWRILKQALNSMPCHPDIFQSASLKIMDKYLQVFNDIITPNKIIGNSSQSSDSVHNKISHVISHMPFCSLFDSILFKEGPHITFGCISRSILF